MTVVESTRQPVPDGQPPLPDGLKGAVGGRKAVYEELWRMTVIPSPSTAGLPPGQAHFRKNELAEAVGLSPSRVQTCLRWLAKQGYIDYTPGTPGKYSWVSVKGGAAVA